MPAHRPCPHGDACEPVVVDGPAIGPEGPGIGPRGDDPVARSILAALQTALDHGVEPAVAEPLTMALTARLAGAAEDGHPDPAPTPAEPTLRRLPPATLRRVVDHMQARLDHAITLDELAREASLSKYYFLRLFAATVGVTPHRYLTALRMTHGAELLRSTDLTVAVVAARCGYATASRFSTVFREHFGTTPGQFRRRTSRT